MTPPRTRAVASSPADPDLDRPAPRRGLPREPGPPSPEDGLVEDGRLALRLADRDRADVPEVELTGGEVTLVEGRAGVEAMRHRLVLDCAARGRSVMHVVGGNRLDSTALARRAQARGLDPGYALRASVVARGFTAYQLSVLLEERLPARLAGDASTAVALVSDPLALYTDEDVRASEGDLLAEQAVASLRRTAREHDRPLVVVQPRRPARRPSPGRRDASPGPSPGRVAELLALVRDHADLHVRVTREAGGGPAGDARVIELPGQGERARVAAARTEQARLDRFAGGGPGG